MYIDTISALSEYSGLFLDLFVTLFGVFIGVYLALWLDRRERGKIEKEERRLIAESLISDLELNLERIKSKDEITVYDYEGGRRKVLLTRFNTAMLNSVINSGKLTLFARFPDLYGNLSDIHQIFSLCDMMSERLFGYVHSRDRTLALPEGKKVLDSLVDGLERFYRELGSLIPETVTNLKRHLEEK